MSNVRFDGDVFPIYLNVGKGINDQKWHIYDITNKIRDTADRINGLERPIPNEGYALTNGISDVRIAHNNQKVNRNSIKSSDERLALPEDGKKKKKYHMSHGQLRADVANRLFELDGKFEDLRANEREAMAIGFERQIMQAFESADKEHNIKRRQGTTIPCLFCR